MPSSPETPQWLRIQIPRRVPNDELLAHEARFDECCFSICWRGEYHTIYGDFTPQTVPGFLLQQYGWEYPYKTGGLSSYPFKGDWVGNEFTTANTMAQELLETVKPPQTSRNRAIHLALISGAISIYRNWTTYDWLGPSMKNTSFNPQELLLLGNI